MRLRWLVRRTALVATGGGVILGCAAIAGLDDGAGGTSSGSSGTSGGEAGGAGGEVEISPAATLEIPPTDCGREGTKSFSLLNRSKNNVDYKVKSIDPVFVIKENAQGTILPGDNATIVVAATPALAQLMETGLVLEINGRSQTYAAKVLGQGATFEASQTAIDFGDVRKENGAETKITIKNLGGKALNTVLEPMAPTTDFEITPLGVSAPSDGFAELTVRLKPGASNLAPIAAQFKPKAAGVCGTIPVLDVRGKRITTDVTIDAVDWGDVLCKSTPGDRDATVKNYGPSPVNFTSTVTGTLFAIKSGGTGTVPAGSEANPSSVKIRLSATPGDIPGQKDETLTITYGGSQTSTGKVREYVAGLVLAINPASGSFSSDGGTEERKTFNITNNAGKFGGYGNLNVGYQATGAGFRTENGTPNYQPAFLIWPPTTGKVDVVFKATGTTAVTGNLTVTGPVCSQTTVALTGANP